MEMIIYKPEDLGNFTQEIFQKSNELGLDVDGARRLNVERYINKLNQLQVDGLRLSIMPEQTKEMVLTAIYQNPAAIQFANEQDHDSKTMVIARDAFNIKYINEPSEEDIQLGIDMNPKSILYAKKYTKDQAKKAIEREINLIFSIKKDFVDEDMILFVLDLCKKDNTKIGDFWQKDYDYREGKFNSPLAIFCNDILKDIAYEISPLFLNFMNPESLNEKQINAILELDYNFFNKISDKKYPLSPEMVRAMLKNSRNRDNYLIFTLLDLDCLTTEFLKEIVEKLNHGVKFHYVLEYLNRNPRADMHHLYFENSIFYIFENAGSVDLSYLPDGYNNKIVIDFAIKQAKINREYVNFWKTKVIKGSR